MRLTKCLALLLTLCMLTATLPAALSEEIETEAGDVASLEEALSIEEELGLPQLDLDLDVIDLDEETLALDVPELETEEVPVETEPAGAEAESAGVEPEAAEPEAGLASNAVYANGRYCTEMSNSTAFVMNGVTIRAGDEGTKGSGNCWKWAQAIYKKVWGCNFDSTFVGTAARGHNLVRNLTDDERRLTAENLKYMVSHAVPGATLRVQSCPSSCSGFNTDGCSKHKLHSLIIAEIRQDGLVTIDDQGSVHTRYYTWENFCKSWANWVYVKYIKWPNAPALTSAEAVDGYGVSKTTDTYRVRATASKGVGVYSLPENGSLVGTLKYPATFKTDSVTLKQYSGYYWAHGKSSTGLTGWVPLTEAVAGSSEKIGVTGVALNVTTLILAKGGTATLKAAIAPVDASNQNVTWSSSDSGVATVSEGVVTARGAGTATITATTVDGGKKATCTVRIADADYSKNLTKTGGNGTVKLKVGAKLQLVPTLANAKGWKIKGVSSSKSKYATVSKTGLVTAKKAGTTTITVKYKNGKKSTVKVKVTKASSGGSSSGGGSSGGDSGDSGYSGQTDSGKVTKIYLNKTGTQTLKKGKTLQLYTKLEPSGATSSLTWKSSNEKIAYVDSNGKVYGLKKGTCTIGVRADNGDVYATVKIKVV